MKQNVKNIIENMEMYYKNIRLVDCKMKLDT